MATTQAYSVLSPRMSRWSASASTRSGGRATLPPSTNFPIPYSRTRPVPRTGIGIFTRRNASRAFPFSPPRRPVDLPGRGTPQSPYRQTRQRQKFPGPEPGGSPRPRSTPHTPYRLVAGRRTPCPLPPDPICAPCKTTAQSTQYRHLYCQRSVSALRLPMSLHLAAPRM